MKREKGAFALYDRIAQRTSGAAAELFRALAQEEARHKLRFELEYDDEVRPEN